MALLGYSQPDSLQALLGDYYSRKQAGLSLLGGALQAAGAGLASGRPGAWAQGLALGGTEGLDNYRRQALAEYGIKQQQDDRAYERGRDKAADDRAEREYKLRVDQYNREKAWNNYLQGRQTEADATADQQKQAQQDYVTGWMGDQTQQGASLPFSPGVRSIARQGGLAGPSATDQWRYDNAQPYVGAQDFGNAFQQITAQPPAPTAPKTRDYMRGDQRIYEEMQPDGTWRELGSGPAYKPTPDTTVNVNNAGEPSDSKLRAELSKKEGETWSNYQQGAASSGGMVQDLQALDELSRLAPQGPITGRLAQMFPGASSAGAVYQSVISRIAPTLRQPGSGSTSDVEYEGFLRSLPSLVNNPEANVAISGILQRKAEINIRRGEIVDKYQNGEISAAEARKQLGALNRQSILDPQMKQLLAATGGGSPNVDDLVKQYTTPQQ